MSHTETIVLSLLIAVIMCLRYSFFNLDNNEAPKIVSFYIISNALLGISFSLPFLLSWLFIDSKDIGMVYLFVAFLGYIIVLEVYGKRAVYKIFKGIEKKKV